MSGSDLTGHAPVFDADRLVADALKHTVQEFPPELNAGAFLIGDIQRGPILPAYGTKERDRILRIYDQMEYNGIWQGAIAGLIKKIKATPWEITGDAYWANYYTTVFHHAQFGRGWGSFISLVLRDFLTQDYGSFIELIGPGAPTGEITGPLGDFAREPNDTHRYYGIAHKDTWRCYVTGNPTWPVVYYSLMTGALHRMHHSRIRRLVDMPNPDERYFGIGLCALSRCIGVAAREIRMGRYVDAYLDDKPKPGITTFQGLTEDNWKKLLAKFVRQNTSDAGDLFGKTLPLFSMDVNAPIKVDSIPFAQTPEKFDFIKYVDLDVNSIALGLGVDRQELWELAGRSLGSGAQSSILAQKAEGKAYGDILQELERLFNISILPAGLEFRFKPKNTVGDSAQAAIDVQYSQVATALSAVPDLTTGAELRQLLANRSQTFSDAFTDEKGSVQLDDSDVKTPDQEVHLTDDAPPEATQDRPIENAKPMAGQKALENDEQRKWFFANNPGFASQGTMPKISAGDDSESARKKMQSFLEDHANHPVASHTWDMVDYNAKGDLVVNPEKTRDAAKAFMSDARDASVPRDYMVSGSRSLYGYQGSDRKVENSINRDKSQQAKAILMASHVGGVKLTDAQNAKLQSAAKGNYLGDKYSQYASGDRGTLEGPKSSAPVSRSGRSNFESAQTADLRKMRYELVNARSAHKDFDATQQEFIDNIVDLLSSTEQTPRRRFGIVFRAQLRRLGQQAFQDGLLDGGVDEPLDEDDLAQVQHWTIAQSAYVSDFANEVYQKGLTIGEIDSHAEMWADKSLREMYHAGLLSADRNGVYEWMLGNTEKHCSTCLRLSGQRHRLKQWMARDLVPGSISLKCGGYHCDCQLRKSSEGSRGRF